MSAARNLTPADVDAVARRLLELQREERAAARARRDEEPVEVSETDLAAARAYARRLGLHVREERHR